MSEVDKHYRKDGEEHHRRAIRLGMNWYQGNITKYAERAPHKGSQNADLVKVLDYTTMWLESPEKSVNPVKLSGEEVKKVRLIGERLMALTGAASGAKQASGITSTIPTGVVLRNYPGDGSVAGPGYLEQSLDPHEVDRANARFQGS